ncbi:hypothetical protein EVJ58_g7049 [Rhodofomes roseus]|uniref:COP9 signalosome complex subunit 3 N-terminal helical repeats domain-containing protein n=1 Tax=Rhodofomes roseus TaxID=34475 RepID=A0A4Y9Y4G6_9APHY|nr:hypothetical protein EVJ58_g7049 [Rhodofomes roseus]
MSQPGSSTGLLQAVLPGSSHSADAPSVDALVAQIVGNDNPDTLARILKDTAPKESRDNALVGMLANGQDPLLVLNPEQHTLGYLYILRFNPEQARLAPQRVTALAKSILRAAHDAGHDKLALGPLYDLLTRYPPSLACLTTLHPLFVTYCVATKHYTLALPVLGVPITTIDLKLSDLTYTDNLQYHYALTNASAGFHLEKHLGLVFQAIDRALHWLIQKLTSTSITLGLADIAKEVGIGSKEEVGSIILSMSDKINAMISEGDTVTFSDPVSQISKEDVDRMLHLVQEQTTRLLYELERTIDANKDYLTKAVKHKDEAAHLGVAEDLAGR